MGMGNLCLQQLCDVRDNSCVICASFIVEHMGFELGRKIKKKYGKCTKINGPSGGGEGSGTLVSCLQQSSHLFPASSISLWQDCRKVLIGPKIPSDSIGP